MLSRRLADPAPAVLFENNPCCKGSLPYPVSILSIQITQPIFHQKLANPTPHQALTSFVLVHCP